MINCSYKLRKTIRRHVRDLLIVVAVGDLVTLFFNHDINSYLHYFWWNSLYSFVIGGSLWKGNELVGHLLHKKVDGYKQPARALAWNLSGMITYSISAIIIVNYLWWVLFIDKPVSFLFRSGLSILLIQMVITIIIASILYSRGFFIAWRESAVNEERLKKESIRLQYNALKNQVNPHFLFNSLNSLTSLVYENPNLAAKFIKQLSEIYRYVLEQKDNELVLLDEEVRFCQRYVFLQQIRHGETLKVNFPKFAPGSFKVVPVSLQILLENAIKHNVVSSEHPLTVDILSNGEYISVQNKKRKRSSIIDSGGIGLKTLINRYGFLSDKKVIVEENEDGFVVKIPIIKTDES